MRVRHRWIDLNADLGEAVADDEAMLGIVSSANIATGAHAGGGAVLTRAVAAAVERGVALGAHPSYRDRAGFGRASHLEVLRRDPSARSHLVADLVAQILLVASAAERLGAELAHVKAHGALYNEAVADPVAAQVVLEAVQGAAHGLGYPLAVMTQPGGELARVAAGAGLGVVAEGFADRGYLHSGQLVPRGHPAAVHEGVDAMVAQALDLAAGHVTPIDGDLVSLVVDSLCVHGDTPGAVAAARAIRTALEGQGWRVAAPGRWHVGDSGGNGTVRAQGRSGIDTPATPTPSAGPGVPAPGGGDRLRIHAFGDRALLIGSADTQPPGTGWVLGLTTRARRRWPEAVVVPGLATVLVIFERPSDRPDDGPDVLSAALAAPHGADDASSESDPAGQRQHRIPTRYDGPDLTSVAAALRLPAAELARRHGAAPWTVAAIGFSPGFGYLTTTDPLFSAVERRPDPRARVPKGAVALAAGMCAVYPSPTPGGWQLIGSTTTELFDVEDAHPGLLRVGDLVRFDQVPG